MDASFKHIILSYLIILEIQNFQDCWHNWTSTMWNLRSWIIGSLGNLTIRKSIFENPEVWKYKQIIPKPFWGEIIDLLGICFKVWCVQIDRFLLFIGKMGFYMVAYWTFVESWKLWKSQNWQKWDSRSMNILTNPIK